MSLLHGVRDRLVRFSHAVRLLQVVGVRGTLVRLNCENRNPAGDDPRTFRKGLQAFLAGLSKRED